MESCLCVVNCELCLEFHTDKHIFFLLFAYFLYCAHIHILISKLEIITVGVPYQYKRNVNIEELDDEG